jgi:hypothetical protein
VPRRLRPLWSRREGDLRQLVFRGKTRYSERTVCDECAEEPRELFLDTPVGAHTPAPVTTVSHYSFFHAPPKLLGRAN